MVAIPDHYRLPLISLMVIVVFVITVELVWSPIELGLEYAFAKGNSSNSYQSQPSILSSAAQQTLLKHSFALPSTKEGTRTVILTAGTHEVTQLMQNLKCMIDETTNRQFVLFSLDQTLTETATNLSIPVIDWVSEAHDNFSVVSWDQPHRFGSIEFSQISILKLDIVRQVMRLGVDVIFTDVDIAWCTNVPDKFDRLMRTYPDYDIFMQSNARLVTDRDSLNTGFYYSKALPSTLHLFDGLINRSQTWFNESAYGDDQSLFWNYTCDEGNAVEDVNPNSIDTTTFERNNMTITDDQTPRFVCQWNNSLVQIFYLPLLEFPNGAADRFARRLYELPDGYYRGLCQNEDISIWHVNNCAGIQKEGFLRSQDLWLANEDNSCELLRS